MNKTKITSLPLKNIPYHTEWRSFYFTEHLNQLHLMQSGLPVQGSSHVYEIELVSRSHLIDVTIFITLKHLNIEYDQETVDDFELTVLPPLRNHLVNPPTISLKSSFK